MIEFKGYYGSVVYDDRDEIFHGRVVNVQDTITFAGTSVRELKKAFHDSVEDYLAFCASRGEQPDKPYSGTLRLRLDPQLHRRAAIAAANEGKSLNGFITESVELRVQAS